MNARNQYAVVMTTVGGEQAAEDLALKILGAKLAACVQVQKIQSYYKWKGGTCSEPECLLLVKTRSGLFVELEKFIRANHTYETPEIIQVPVNAGSAAYLRWIDEATADCATQNQQT
jgi:periplasmic divalent cation tolerance protein